MFASARRKRVVASQQRMIVLCGQSVEYTLRVGARSRRVRLAVHGDGRVTVSIPRRASMRAVEDFLLSKADWIVAQVDRARKNPRKSLLHGGTHADFLLHQAAALRFARERVAHFCTVYGVKAGVVRVRNQRTRWGSCARNGNLSFNYRIALLPPHLADYVIVHEVCHLKEFNHSRRFWELVGECVEDPAGCRKELRG